jgi:hypothetical protein
MISSTVVSFGGVFSSGPSWARAGKAVSVRARSEKRSAIPRNDGFIGLVYRNCEAVAEASLSAPLHAGGRELKATFRRRSEPRRPSPSTPLRSVRPKGKTLQFCHFIGCEMCKGVAAGEAIKKSPTQAWPVVEFWSGDRWDLRAGGTRSQSGIPGLCYQ